MGKIIAISNQKGGVGKTTTAINVATGLAYANRKVLLVDFDMQGNASQGLSALKGEGQPTVYSVLMEKFPIEKALIHIEESGVDILPANISLAGADLMMDKIGHGKERLLKEALDPLRNRYDYILIDCPPSLGLLNTNALTAADSVLIPVQCEYYALEGVALDHDPDRAANKQSGLEDRGNLDDDVGYSHAFECRSFSRSTANVWQARL